MGKLKIKPRKQLHINIAIWFNIIFFVIFGILTLIITNNLNVIWIGLLAVLGISVICFVCYCFARIFCDINYTINRDEIVVVKSEEEVFKIRKEQIYEVAYKKMTFGKWLTFPVYMFMVGMSMKDMEFPCGILSIRYYDAEKENSKNVMGTLIEEEKTSGLRECCEYFSKRDLKKIVEILGVEVKEL